MACMEFEWDEAKRRSNLGKHGVDFEQAIHMFAGAVIEWRDERHDYGEARWIALGELDRRVLVIVYADRGDVRRIISARKANAREQRTYRQALAGRSQAQS